MVQPIIPDSADKILNMLSIPSDKRLLAHINADNALSGGIKIEKPEGVFPRLALDEGEE